MATLYNTKISATYSGLVKTIDSAAITAALKELTDGTGLQTGLYINTAGDFKVTSILEWGSLKDTGTGVTITQFVTAADGIGNFNNDTTVPTSAAVKTYVDAVVTASDLDFLGDSNVGTPAVDLDSQNFSILGTANEIETSGNAQTLTIGLPTSVTITDTFTGATFVGDLNGTINTATTATTQVAGNNSTKVATTAYVDTLDSASDLDFSGDTGTGDVNLNTQVFAITGTTNQITTAAASQGLLLSLPATVHRNLTGNVTGNVTGDLTGNVTGNVAGDLTGNVTATSVLANGVTATTQTASDNSTKVATTAYVDVLDSASDLDITDGVVTGDVNLNTQSLSILGTTNQVTSTVLNQSVTLSLPSSINVNSASATILETARDISLTGQATATISSFDGSVNVSGAVTLDNNSVTGKVLTGLPTPAAATVLPADSILDGIGKLQSQINGLAGGLRFIGSWNATANSPSLSSGGGEAASGTTTGTTANKLVDSTANFSVTVTIGDQVVNQVDGQTALVTNVDSSTILSLDADIIVSGEAYTIDNTPFLTQGHYYVVSVGGTTSLNGIANWSVGDWVIAGANNEWTQLDHTDVEGVGTVGNIPKWSATGTIADSIMAEAGTEITVSGILSTTTNLNSGSNFAVATNKFTANATTGNVAFEGDLAINTNKFTVNATTGNVDLTGDINSTGADLVLKSDSVTALTLWDSGGQGLGKFPNNLYVIGDLGVGTEIPISKVSINSNGIPIFAAAAMATTGLTIHNSTGGTAIQIGTYDAGSYNYIQSSYVNSASTARELRFYNGAVNSLTLDTSGDATFAGTITGTTATFIKDQNADSIIQLYNANAGAAAQSTIYVGNSAVAADALFLGMNGTGMTTAGGFVADGASIGSGSGASGGLALFAREASSGIKFYTGGHTDLALTLDSSQNATFAGNVTLDNILLTPATLPAINTPSISLRSTNNEIYFQAGSTNVFNFMKADYTTMLNLDGTNSATFSANVNIIKTTSDVAGELRIGGTLASDDLPFGKINFANTAAANIQTNDVLAYIAGEKTGSSNRGELTFATSNDSAPVERMRIDSSGNSTFAGNVGVTNGNITTGLGATLGGVRYSGPSGYYSFITRNSTNAWTLSLLGTDGAPANDAIGTDIFSVTYAGNATFTGAITLNPPVAAGTSTYFDWQNNSSTFAYSGSHASIVGGGGANNFVPGWCTGSNDLIFGTANTERMRITSGGNIGINYTTPFNQLSGTETTLAISNANVASLYLDCSHVNGHNWALTSGTAGSFQIINTTDSVTPLTIDASQNATFAGGIYLAGAAAIDSNKLDYYEEGTWTPLIDGSTSVTGQTYSRQEGAYTRIGNMVTAWFCVTLTAKGTIVGSLRVSGLPWNGSASPYQKPAAVAWSNMNLTAGHQLAAQQYAANPFMYLFEMDVSGAITQIYTASINDTTSINGTLTYKL